MSLVPFVPNFVLIGGYGYMAYRFARGFRSTTYQQDYRIPLAMFWPFLFAVNGSFRKNFLTAIKSED
ncbi:hypothetical protein NDN08_006040 [Rhodosorus marinus]|uniref:Uncharacterized protein n=1 Tax=Rhodosorus marinus TaxID=101924 RepID=A0AAV8UJI6_9RHOD|nr:hypothetical protein NDN08_006040 [Rhodosorus marinus]